MITKLKNITLTLILVSLVFTVGSVKAMPAVQDATPTSTPGTTEISTNTVAVTSTATIVPPTVTLTPASVFTLNLFPTTYTTTSGSTGGQPVNVLAVKDQSGRNNNAKAYVLFKTPGVVYEGLQVFRLPENIQKTALNTMLLNVNFMAPDNRRQIWSWFIYNWAIQDWTPLGTSRKAKENIWTMLKFAIPSPDQFVDVSGEIRMRLRSSDASGDAKIDYEAIYVTYNSADLPTATATSASTSVPPTNTAIPTSTPVVLPTQTAIPAFTSTSLPPTPTNTLLPTKVVTSTPTATSIPPTATATATKISTPVVTSTPTDIPLPSPTAINTKTLSSMIPAYFYPGSYWNQLITTGTAGEIAIANPNNGPGSAKDTLYQSAIQQAIAKNITIAGYVYTGYGTRDITIVKSDIDKYFTWYGLTTIFVDEASNNINDIPYYRSLYQYVKQRGGLVIINPGTITDEQYMSVSDIVMIVETTYAKYITKTFPAWIANYPANRFVHLIYATPQESMIQTINLAKQRNAGYVYVTDDDIPNPWDTLPPYWNQEILQLH